MLRKLSMVAGISLLVLIAPLVASDRGGDTTLAAAANAGRTAVVPTIAPAGTLYVSVIEPFDLVAPSGKRIYGLIRRPDPGLYPTLVFPAVVYVPGGTNPGRLYAAGIDARRLAEAGMVFVSFNAEGRVDTKGNDVASEGANDANGFRDQDALAAVVAHVMGLPDVLADHVGLWSQSYGITMAAGCAARHPELAIAYLVDGEGPGDSFVTCHEPYALDDDPSNDRHELVRGLLGHYSLYRDPSDENVAFWKEREAVQWIGQFRGRYLRLQATWDHAQPPQTAADLSAFELPPLWWHNKHAMDMVSAALDGGVPWVRVNLETQRNRVNARYSRANPPTYLPGRLADAPWGARAVLELAAMPSL